MKTHTLYSLYFSDLSSHKPEYERRFHDPDSVHLDFMIKDHPAFFLPNAFIYQKAYSIEKANNAINQLCSQLPELALHQFALRCLVDEIVLSNNIEGVHSTRKEISEILTDLSGNSKTKRFSGLVNKYVLLMGGENIPINTCTDIRKIYDDLFLEEIEAENKPDGKIFRKGRVSVYSATGKEIHHGLSPESAVIEGMEKALAFLNNTNVDLLFRVSVFHYLFGYIHPFYDGNGRTSRFISSYILSKGYNHIIAYRIAFTIKENLGKYYDAFKICNSPASMGDLTPFIEMFLNVLDISMNKLQQALEERLHLFNLCLKQISSLPHGDDPKIQEIYKVLIQATLFSDYGISSADASEAANMSKTTFMKRLKEIPDYLIKKHLDRRVTYYSLVLPEL